MIRKWRNQKEIPTPKTEVEKKRVKHAFPLTRFGVATRLHVTMLRDYCVHFTRICANGTRFAPHMLQLKRTLVFREYVRETFRLEALSVPKLCISYFV